MNLKQLEAFRAVMIMGSVTGAAEMLSVSQPGVSRLIGDLERSIGFKLFVRHKGRLHPTPEGLSFHEELDRSFVGLDRLRSTADEIKAMRRGHIRIAAMPAVSLDLLPDAIRAFKAEHADLKITLEVHQSPRIIESVSAQNFDIGVAQLTTDQPGVEIVHSFVTDCVCVAHQDHRFRSLDHVTPADLVGEPFISYTRNTLTALHVDRVAEEANVRRDIQVETQPSFTACSMASKGVGIALVDPLTAAFFGDRRIITRPFVPVIPFGFRIIRPAHMIISRAAKSFIERLKAMFLRHPAVL